MSPTLKSNAKVAYDEMEQRTRGMAVPPPSLCSPDERPLVGVLRLALRLASSLRLRADSTMSMTLGTGVSWLVQLADLGGSVNSQKLLQ